MNIIKNASEKLSTVREEASESVPTKLQAMLKKETLDYRHLPVSVRYSMGTMQIPLKTLLLRKFIR
jgi:hypothetical protein